MDIVRDVKVIKLIGAQWYGVETDARGETFRWVGNDASLEVTQAAKASVIVRMDVEPGPAVGGKRFVLALVGKNGSSIASTTITVRRHFELLLPPIPRSNVHVLKFRVDQQDAPIPVPDDKRVLNFRVFRIEAVAVPEDATYGGPEAALRDEVARAEAALAAAGEARGQLEARNAVLERELAVRDGVIERLEAAAGRARTDAEAARRSAEEKEKVIRELDALSQERLQVIRALHQERQGA